MRLCNVSVVVGVDGELEESSVDDVSRLEDRIVSQWWEVSADERHEMRDKVDELLRPFGFETRLLVIDRANSIALYFICLTLSAVMSLRDQWLSGELRNIVESLFTFLSVAARPVRVNKLSWPQDNYKRCLKFFHSVQGKKYDFYMSWSAWAFAGTLAVCAFTTRKPSWCKGYARQQRVYENPLG